MRVRRLLRVLTASVIAAAAASARAEEVLVAVAANFTATLQQIAADFEATSGHRVRLASGATGKFYSQVRAGAPFEVLLAADPHTPQRLLAEGHAVAGTGFTYAVGRLVLWSADPARVDAGGRVLDEGRFRHLAIANPVTAPYGTAAMQTLQRRGLDAALASRLVTGESIAQAFQFVATGHAELGFVALSQLNAPGAPAAGSMWLVPATLHAPIRQDAVLLLPGRDNPAARALLAWLKGPQARSRMRDWGYETP